MLPFNEGDMKRRVLFTTLLILLANTFGYAQESPRWLRHSSISPDGKTVAFAYQGDIFTVSSDGGVATFSVGIASTGRVKSLTLGIRGNKEDDTPAVHHDNQVWYDGIIITDTEKVLPDIIDITRTPVKTKYSGTATFDSSDLGKIFSTNCHLYTSVATAKAAGTDPMCMVTCIKGMINQYDDSADPQMSKGLGMCLYPIEVGGQTRITWDVANDNISNAPQPYFSGHSVLRVGLPGVRTIERMAQCFGGSGGLISRPWNQTYWGGFPSDRTF